MITALSEHGTRLAFLSNDMETLTGTFMKLIILTFAVIVVAIIAFTMIKRKSMEKYFQLPADQAIIIDVRSKQEYDSGHFSAAINIPHNVIANQIKQLEPYKQKYVILYCHSGNRSTIAMNILRQNGFEHVVNAGGYEAVKRFDKK
jgi:phage shock protein E